MIGLGSDKKTPLNHSAVLIWNLDLASIRSIAHQSACESGRRAGVTIFGNCLGLPIKIYWVICSFSLHLCQKSMSPPLARLYQTHCSICFNGNADFSVKSDRRYPHGGLSTLLQSPLSSEICYHFSISMVFELKIRTRH